MLELLTIVIFFWLVAKVIGLALKLTWGVAKIVAGILIGLAFPALFVIIFFVGGIALMIPLVMLAIAGGILKACL